MKKRKIDMLLEEYGVSHQNKTNKNIHWVCIPVIFFSLIGLLFSIPFIGQRGLIVNWAAIVLFLALIYYIRLSFSMFLGFLCLGLLCLWLNFLLFKFFDNNAIQLTLFSAGLFVLAWIGQFIGHKIEGAKPSFIKDVQFLLIGPAWLMHYLMKLMRIPY
jgi:uncharacterized membrane protein YGL010W